MRRALVISHSPVGAALAGPAIRSAAFARALKDAGFEVWLAGERGEGVPELAGIPFVPYSRHAPHALRGPIAEADLVVTQPPWPGVAAWLRASSARVIVDLYDPEPLEVLEFLRGRRRLVRRTVTSLSLDRLVNALHLGHAFLCASERQRDLWTGTLLSQRLLTPALVDADPGLPGLFGVVPFGVDDSPPVPGPGPRERFGLRAADEVVLWNGGLWAWLDPETALRGAARLAERRPGVRLVFMGASADAQGRAAADGARRLAGELGLLDSVVFFNDAWVPHAERGGWLLQADCALSTHADHLETRYAFRTRLLDCFWAGLPVVCTEGDDLAARVAAARLGETVPAGDPEAIADALERVLGAGRESFSGALARAADELRWSRVTEPLVALASSPSATRSLGERAGRSRAGLPVRARNAAYRAASSALAAARLGDRVRLR